MVEVGEICSQILDRRGVTPIKLGGDFIGTPGKRVISAKSIKSNRVDLGADEERYVSDEIYKKWMKTPLLAGDVLLTSEAPVGNVAYIKETQEWCLGQRLFCLRPNTQIADGRYLFYALQTQDARWDIDARSTGSTVSGIRQTELVKIVVPLHSIDRQKAIAHILGTLDDKIELNRKTNETLEAVAKALFKSWFVDFDPVRAKAEGRPTGLPAEISDLFPDSFEDSELGEVPSGWEVFSLDQMLDTISETLPLMEREKVVFLNTGDILNGEFLVSEYVSSRGLPGQAKKSIRKGDILFSEIRPGNGRHAFVCFDAYDYVVSTKLMVLRSRNRLDSLFEYFLITLSSSIQILKILAESRSGTFPQITFSELSSVKYPLPVCRDLTDVFDAQFLRPFHERSTLLTHQNILLSQTRDALLPKLISGEIRISDAEKMLEDVEI
jgi:type I restriction enzyme S subunit